MALYGQFPEPLMQSARTKLGEEYSRLPSASVASEEHESEPSYRHLQALSKQFAVLQQENESIKNAVMELRNDRDNLRSAIRNLKMENNRFKAKLKRMSEAMKSKRANNAGGGGDNDGGGGDGVVMDTNQADVNDEGISDDSLDYDNIRQFLLIGGPNDPLSVEYRASIRDANGNEHKTVERYLLYKMAETFGDEDAMKKILDVQSFSAAEELAQSIKNFDQKTWDSVKLRHWEEGQRMKFDQYRSLKCLLVKTNKYYIAIASKDKVIGTGWRKQREEAVKPRMWDGENRGGKYLMKLRDEYASSHVWESSNEEQEAYSRFNDCRLNVWRKTNRAPERSGGAPGNRRNQPKNSSSAAMFPANFDHGQGMQPLPGWYGPVGHNGPNAGFGPVGQNGPNAGFMPFQSRPRASQEAMMAYNKRWRM